MFRQISYQTIWTITYQNISRIWEMLYSTQHFLFYMLNKWKHAVDNRKELELFFTELPKAYDCLSHQLLIAKLHCCGFSLVALKLMHSYSTKNNKGLEFFSYADTNAPFAFDNVDVIKIFNNDAI